MIESEGEPVREIDSVMMTTSGFISSAREGKLPEAKRPDLPLPVTRSDSPSTTKSPSSLIRKKSTMEKIMRHKNHQGGIRTGHLLKFKSKDGKLRPKIPSAPPGTGSLGQMRGPPKLKIPVPTATTERERSEAQFAAEKQEKKRKRDEKRREQKKRERKERDKDPRFKDRMRIRMRGLTREEELKRYKERENELIAKLAASSVVTVTSIPPPSLRVREKTPEPGEEPKKPITPTIPGILSKYDNRNKLSIFKKKDRSLLGTKPRHRDKTASKSSKISKKVPMPIDVSAIKEEPVSPPSSPPMNFAALSQDTHASTPTISKGTGKGRQHKESKHDRKSGKIKNKGASRSERGKKSPKFEKHLIKNIKKSPVWHMEENDEVLMGSSPKTPDGGRMDQGNSYSLPNAPSFIPPFSQFTPFGYPNVPLTPTLPEGNSLFLNKDGSPLAENNRPPTPSAPDFGSPIQLGKLDSAFVEGSLPPTPKLPKERPSFATTPKTTKSKSKLKAEKEKVSHCLPNGIL